MAEIQQQEITLAANEALEWPISGKHIRFVTVNYACKFGIDGGGKIDALSGRTVYAENGQEIRTLSLVNGATEQTITFIYGDDRVSDDRQSGEVTALITNDETDPVAVEGKVVGPNSDKVIVGHAQEKLVCGAVSVPSGVLTFVSPKGASTNIFTAVVVQNLGSGPVRIGDASMTAGNKNGLHVPAGASATLPGGTDLYCIHAIGVAADLSISRMYWEDA
ncbi:MAG TPA: hypothetical protein DFI00_08220 [Rhodospirillaceae bacterium]|nr:hypothetical protein [Alphaproteobacteria bacterium]OUT42365.1 MAG: hypothetical protein CBB62_08805 [Micavibrio sp. TMED2]HCI47265.1 hypothetical protein [Rhodospirillaceae bacterium]MAS46000.1 hypothetical protein [Alphaproteobacteria bacterium]MAX95818.1 hypothetical protein [Alphaproteobacteria bacterium]|tara:strand:- start:5082 stop:5741 length:660 start_codon:yes stop_codon:yes gene_type:complete